MGCSKQDVVNDSLSKARNILKGNAAAVTLKGNTATIEYGKSKYIKHRLAAYNFAVKRVALVADWAEKTFGKPFREGWTTFDQTSSDRIKIHLSFPSNLYKAYEVQKGEKTMEEVNEEGTVKEVIDTDLANKISALFPEIKINFGFVDGIAGQADMEALSVLLNPEELTEDTLPHEYAHHYISWFRETPLVKEAIEKWGSEEALVQAIGEQVVVQKGEALGWWKKFTNWVQTLFDNLSTKSKEELRDIITDAFLTRTDIETGGVVSLEKIQSRLTNDIFNQESSTGSKKNLKGIEKVVVDSLKRLEMRKAALEHEGKKEKSAKQQMVIDFMTISYEQGKFLDAVNSYLEHALKDLENIQEDIDKALINKMGSNAAAHIIKNMMQFAETHKNISTDIIQELKKEYKGIDNNEVANKLLNEARKIKEISEELQKSYIEMAREQGARFLIDKISSKQTVDSLMKLLEEPARDISFTETWITAMANAKDDVLRMINKVVEDEKEKSRLEVLDIHQELMDLKLELEEAGISNTEFMYKHKDGLPTGFYTTERDWSSAKGAFRDLYKEFKDKTGVDYKKYKYDDVEIDSKFEKYATDFTERMKAKRNEIFLTPKEATELVKEKRGKLSTEDFNRWLKMNTVEKEAYSDTTDTSFTTYTIPRKLDNDFNEISSNSLKTKFYNKIVDLNIEYNDTFPPKFKDYRRVPQLRKDAVEKIKAGNIKGFAGDILESFKVLEDEAERGIEYGITNERGEIINFIPIYFTKEVEDKKMLSVDAVTSMVTFVNMANDRRHMLSVVDNLEILKDVIRARDVVQETASGKTRVSSQWAAGIKFMEPFLKGDGGYISQRLEEYLNMVVYGQHHVKGKSILGVDSEKAIDALSKYTAVVQLALNIYAGINNVSMGKAMLRVESMSKEFFEYGDLLSADKIYTEQLAHTMGDVGRRVPTSKLGLWLLQNNTMENYSEEVANLDAEKKNIFARMFHTSTLFFLSKAGEHYIHSKSSLALAQQFRYSTKDKKFMMKHRFFEPVKELDLQRISEINALNIKELKENGISISQKTKEINDRYNPQIKELQEKLNTEWETLTNYWEAHEIKNGRLTLKAEYSTNKINDHLTFVDTQHSINRALQGNYGLYATAIQKYALGRAAMMFRKWMKPAWDRRFQSNRFDELRDADTEGYYRSIFRFLTQLTKDLNKAQFSMAKSWSSLTIQDKQNFKRAMTEVTYLLAVATLVGILGSLSGGDDDWLANMGAYQANRLFTELGALIPGPQMITEGLRLLENPLANVSPIRDWIQFLQFWEWGETIERGKWKDMTKFERGFYKVLPLGKTLKDIGYPEEKLVFYNLM